MARKLSLELETETLEQTELEDKVDESSELNAETLEESKLTSKRNKPKKKTAKIPLESLMNKEPPHIVNPEYVVVIDGVEVEIKPTKYKYFRNRFTSYYKYIKEIPISDFLILPEGAFGNDTRSGDQVIFDFLCAVFDDPYFVQDHYDNMDAELMERILDIYGKVNHIKDKEENTKNRQAQTTA